MFVMILLSTIFWYGDSEVTFLLDLHLSQCMSQPCIYIILNGLCIKQYCDFCTVLLCTVFGRARGERELIDGLGIGMLGAEQLRCRAAPSFETASPSRL